MKKLFYIFLLLPFLMVAQSSHFVIVGPGMTYTPSELTISQGDMFFGLVRVVLMT